jgi:hypothetical protein
MEHSEKKGIRARHVFAFMLAVVMGLTNIWIIQLAREGDPVGYMILTFEGVLGTILVVGLVIAFVIGQTAKVNNISGPPRRDLKDLYDTTRLLNQQNKTLRQILEEQGLGAPQLMAPQTPLRPGQMMTADGMVIEGQVFDALDDEE